MPANRFLAIPLVLSTVTATATGQFTQLTGPCDFGPAQVVGEDPWTPGVATRLGFDLFPDGSAVTTPNPVGGGLYGSAPLGATFQSVGVTFGVDDIAVSYPINPAGLGTWSPPNSMGGGTSGSFNEPIAIHFVDPTTGSPTTVPAAGMWIADGPTNDVSVTFLDANNSVIVTLPPGPPSFFAGIAAPGGIATIQIATSLADDYYIDDLYYGPAPFAGGLVATETTRAGNPANPTALLHGQTSRPIIGATWDPVIDHTSFVPGAVFDVLGLATAPGNVPFQNWGTILLGNLVGTVTVVAGTPFAIPIPNDCALMDADFHVQGLSTDGPTLALTNAIDISIGNL